MEHGSILAGGLGLVAILVVVLLGHDAVRRIAIVCFSRMIHEYLIRAYPTYHSDGKRQIPTVPYQWPDGQGDVGKFLDGIENSAAWEKENGRVYRIWSGMTPEIVLASPDHLRHVFQDSARHSKAVNNNSGWLLGQILGSCVGLVSGETWRALRGATDTSFTHGSVKLNIGLVRHRIQDYIRDLERTGPLASGLLDPAGDMKMMPFLVVADIIYGGLSADMEKQLRQLAPVREELFRHVINGGLPRYTWSQYLPTTANKLLGEFKTRWANFNDAAARRATSLSLNAPVERMYAELASGKITVEQLHQTLDESLYANLDVTTGALSWNIVFLAANPEAQRRLREEFASRSADMDTYLMDSNSYLSACILESSRLKPLAAFSVPQSAPTERIVDGYVIPAGTNFVVDSYAVNIRHDYWGADRAQWRPDRFIDLKNKDLRYHFWRFGFGSRQCMGKYVADLMLRALLWQLVTDFDMSLDDPKNEWARDERSWITHPKMKIKCSRRTVS